MKKRLKPKLLTILGLVIFLLTPLIAMVVAPVIAPLFCDKNDYLPSVCAGNALLFYAYPLMIIVSLLIGSIVIAISLSRKK